MSAQNYQTQQKASYIGVISGLMNELQKLAPHPERPDYKGPLFINNNPYMKSASESDGMLGCMIMEALVGTAFAQMFSETIANIGHNLMDALDCYSEYVTDIQQSEDSKSEHGQGTLARLSSKPIKGHFNQRASISEGMQAFYNDLPRRMEIENALAYYGKKILELDNEKFQPNAPKFGYAA